MDSKVRVLIVEDQESIQIMLSKDLRKIGLESDIHCCDRIEDAMNIIKERKLDIIFLDLNLKNGDKGMDLLKSLKKRRSTLPVVIISSEDDIKFIIDAIEEGAVEFIVKPWNKKVLVQKISFSLAA